ncbi:MAG: hypothetical protein PHH37_08850 [Paludibacter sp.]|nr:hypothetical protein [Paludibacter sp.]
MKGYFNLSIIFVIAIVCQSFIFENNNHKATRLVNNDLKYIEKCTRHIPKDTKQLIKAINNMERITGIRSGFGFDLFGRRYLPTQQDINRWRLWVEKNKRMLRWDNEKKQVYLYVEKKMPGKIYEI